MSNSQDALLLVVARQLVADGGAKTLRENSRLSISDLARAVDTSPSVIWRYEKSGRLPPGPVATRYARFLAALQELARNGARA